MRQLLAAASMAAAVLGGGTAHAALVFVGSWQVDEGPSWSSSPPDGPLAYTGQEAAALLFGGSAGDYVISTQGVDPNAVDFNAWYSVIGYADGVLFAQDYSSKYLGLYYGPTSGYPDQDIGAAASAYVSDNATGATYTNYAFIDDGQGGVGGVPEPATWALMITGFGLAGAAMRRRASLTA
ncbi:PEPxxWA-CTERM sorting domain-containing protein [Phenylobacterium sp.]|uniref:PEPxxWA-CTERM sorting domain-containing protein n=1 Tax=Phenylobacterium sp. TaxID=1871053 RepID=UPI0025F3B07D|nr:PEPxxWA-CTERM sorting domain-containing protein [Phenylobacterium sp.]